MFVQIDPLNVVDSNQVVVVCIYHRADEFYGIKVSLAHNTWLTTTKNFTWTEAIKELKRITAVLNKAKKEEAKWSHTTK